MPAKPDFTTVRAGNGARKAPPQPPNPLGSLPVRNYDLAGRSDFAGLTALQDHMMRNYFRLLRAQQELDRRAHSRRGNGLARSIEQVEAERSRLAHELHATAGQALAGIKIHLELIDAALPGPPENVRASLHRIGLLAQEALQELRAISRRMHPPDWQKTTLQEALACLWDTTGIGRKFDAKLDIVPLAAEPPHHLRVLLYRVAQEALANVVRHARATRVRLWLGPRSPDSLQIIVEDNGAGFDPAGSMNGGAPRSGGIGLRSMREQLRAAGGELSIESASPGGTRLSAWVPTTDE